MEFPHVLSRDLAALTEALDNPGTDLQAVLAVLTDDLRTAVSSFIGLTMTVEVDGNQVTLTTLDSSRARTAGASLQLPLDVFGAGDTRGTVLFYAAHPGAFVDLAADSRRVLSLDGQVRIDGHLTADPGHPGVTGLTDATLVNRAIGVLLDQGFSPHQAHDELRRRAAAAAATVPAAAESLLSSIAPAGPADDGSTKG